MKRDREFLDYYERARIEDQLAYYRERADWNRKRDEAMIVLVGLLMFVASLSAAVVVAKWDWLGPRVLWMALATLAPALSAALAATRALYAYEQHHMRYDTTHLDLRDVRAEKRPAAELDDAAFRTALAEYVTQVDELLAREHRQWAHITTEIPLPEPPQPRPRPPQPPAETPAEPG
ncbi:MAG: SLATT domain-containing protein [Gemmatimonadales bacterium]